MTDKWHSKSKKIQKQKHLASKSTMDRSCATISRESTMTTSSQENLRPRYKMYHNRFLAGLFTLTPTLLLPRAWSLVPPNSFVNTSDNSGRFCLGFRIPIVCCISCKKWKPSTIFWQNQHLPKTPNNGWGTKRAGGCWTQCLGPLTL